MTNIEKLAKLIAKNGGESILIHTIPGTPHWIICEKISEDKWYLTLCDPMKTSMYNLGIISQENHLRLWKELVEMEIDIKIKAVEKAQKLVDKWKSK